ncbi:SH3 domain-containing protein [Variovorax guangxiensis]|uniref:Peptide-binding protein n=1 Tax=Variovorax guangxiensis TaxID=1775474 RepID=A0A502E2K7_9BURK|nr:SH3 domain-containing protein [Variovorax guangxiensis]RZI69597.1 MAG: peptide-binding protein [Variovorax sp.]TPG27048.1 peptide-binding protein [Variovorax ginsengisoli]TPG30776.1 peptide-binding protein [Variovorax guangxiensis]
MTHRRFSAFLLAAALFLLGAVSTAHARDMVSVARGEVNMRSAPGTRSEVQWALSRGYPLQVLSRRGGWLQVRDFENDRGWVLRSLTARTPHHVVKAPVANLRATPSTRGRLVGKATRGEVLRTIERKGAWVKVRHANGRTGWVASRLVWGW